MSTVIIRPTLNERAHARQLLAAIRTLQVVEQAQRTPTPEERVVLATYGGCGPVANRLFANPLTGAWRDEDWQALGQELRTLLTPEEYTSVRRTIGTAFYTPELLANWMYLALARLGLPTNDALVLEPGCGSGQLLGLAPPGLRFVAVEMDSISARIAQTLYPQHTIHCSNFRDVTLPQVHACIANVPFADIHYNYWSHRLSLHEFCIAKSLDALIPGGLMVVIVTHFLLDRADPSFREAIAAQADFLGAVRLPSGSLAGTSVVADILVMRKRLLDTPARHVDHQWTHTTPILLDRHEVRVSTYFQHHPHMKLGTYSHEDRLYGSTSGYSVTPSGDLATQLAAVLPTLPQNVYAVVPPAASIALPRAPLPLPSLAPHISEGSLFVATDHAILQVQHGEAVPVCHSTKPLYANGRGLLEQRLAALLHLRDVTRGVLQSQNDGWAPSERDVARQALNEAYDAFVVRFGCVNKTTIHAKADGSVTRRMPNTVVFRDDPDFPIVLSLEEYDEETDTATKAAIMLRDVVGHALPVTTVASAEEALLQSLNTHGAVDLPYMAHLYSGSPRQIIDELGDLLYQDPETGAWQTADAYLSGNVRAKLVTATAAGNAYRRNVAALALVQPEDVLPSDIDVNLGAPWIPPLDIQAFAAALFHVEPDWVQIRHVPKEALWEVRGHWRLEYQVAVKSDYGTQRCNGVTLLEQALNLQVPTIYDTRYVPGGKEERVVNQDDTLAAREKQKAIKEAFKAWLWTEPERTDRLVRTYNDTYNNLRLRAFDGGHLTFPGMNPAFYPYAHQKDGIWRIMCAGNSLMAQLVGAGKSAIMAAAAMKMRQAGLIRKSICVVPNHLLEQFGREFLHVYPNAKLLMASREDFTRARRKLLTAKMASQAWDAILVTHSSFERIGMSLDFQTQFLREQIAEYETLLVEREETRPSRRGGRSVLKLIENQLARLEAKLKDLLAEEKKDDGLVFDELGIDYIFYDESQAGKNLAVASKMERVAGIQTGGSQRAFDLFMKCRYLHQRHPGHGVTFATGTPVSNSMVELYTLQRYLDPAALRERGIEHFDAWAATFGEVVETMEISPDGRTLRPRSRFAKFINLPELLPMFGSFADVKTAAQLTLPRPTIQGGKPHVIACPMDDAQRVLQDGLVDRYEKIRNGHVKPWEDNALAVTTDGRKLALSPRLLDPLAEDCPWSKVNRCIEQVYALWEATAAGRSTQLVFCDFGVHPNAWGYSVYGEVVDKLVKAGIPVAQVAVIGDADTDAKKHVLFDKVRSGAVRILIGSTQKMGTGMNVQRLLIALHHLDAPWKPAEVEQREGRILRQGNTHPEVQIYRYVTEGSFDAYMWQTLETKATFIGQIMTGDLSVRQAEDISGQELSYAEVKAIASGNPAILTLAETDAELKRLSILRKNYLDEQFLTRRALGTLPEKIQLDAHRLAALIADQTTMALPAETPWVIEGQPATEKDAREHVGLLCATLPEQVRDPRSIALGHYRGLVASLRLYPFHAPDVALEGRCLRLGSLAKNAGPLAILNALERLAGSSDGEQASLRRDLQVARAQLADYETRRDQPFAHEDYLAALTSWRLHLARALQDETPAVIGPQLPLAVIIDALKGLRSAHSIEPAPQRLSRQASASVEEAVTTRILARAQVREAVEEAPAVVEMPSVTVAPAANGVVPRAPRWRSTKRGAVLEQAGQLRLF